MPFVGLTGGLGAGKSTALAALERLGAAVLSSDAVVHELYEGAELRDAVVARFGAEVAPAGVVDRAALAARAFATRRGPRWLEGLSGRWSARGWRAWLEQARTRTAAAARRRWSRCRCCSRRPGGLYDATIAVIAEEQVRRERAAGRGHALVDERAARQLSQQEKARRATFVVRNDGSEEELERELSAVLDKLGG